MNTQPTTEPANISQLKALIESFISIYEDDDSLTRARKFVAAAFNHRPIINLTLPPAPKAPWLSGGTRNEHGSLKKFNDSRSNMIWISKYPVEEVKEDKYGNPVLDKDGKEQTVTVWKYHTRNLGRNEFKRHAKRLGKIHGIPYGQSLRLLQSMVEQRIAEKQGESNEVQA